jgi:hypothetical protein
MKKLSWKLSVLFLCVISLCLVRCGDDDCPTCPKHPATLYLSVHKIDLGTTATSATFDIKNTGEKTLEWTITTSGGNWLGVSPTSGSDDKTITVTANRGVIEILGQHKAKVYVTAGSLKDSVEVSILYAGKWLIKDDGSFEGCLAAVSDYFWLVNLFNMPEGMNHCFVDSVKINFCEAGPIRLRAFNAKWDFGLNLYWPDEMIIAEPGQLQGQIGWNTFKVNWYMTMDPFFVGYLQPELTTPDLNYDIVQNDTTSYLYDWVQSVWYLHYTKVFYIRIYITPVLEYAPKISPEHTPLDLTPRERETLSQRKEGGLIR